MIELFFNEATGCWEEKKEPYMVIEFPTKEDYELFEEMIAFYKEHHKQEEKTNGLEV